MDENIERLLEDRGVLIDPGDKRRPEQIYEALFGMLVTAEIEIYDPTQCRSNEKLTANV